MLLVTELRKQFYENFNSAAERTPRPVLFGTLNVVNAQRT